MGMQITNMTEVITAFKLVDTEVNEAAREALEKGAERIMKTTRHNAPVEEHRLENAIKLLPKQGNRYMLRLTIAVTGVVAGRSVDEYAAIVHEYQWSKRGPLTRRKGPQSGPRYLARAITKHKAELMADLSKAMGKAISRAIDKSNVNRPKAKRRRR